MKVKSLIVGAVLAVLCGSVQSAEPSRASLERYVKLLKVEESFADEFRAGFLASAVAQTMYSIENAHPDATDEQLEQAHQVVQRHLLSAADKIIADKNFRNQIIDQFVWVMSHNYTQEEINAINAFYSSRLGQGIAQKQHLVHQEFMKTAAPYSIGYAENYFSMPENSEKFANLRNEVEKIFTKR